MRAVALIALAALVTACRASLPPPSLPLTRTTEAPKYETRPAPLKDVDGPKPAPIVQRKLDNGLTVFVVEQPGVPLTSIGYINRAAQEFQDAEDRPIGLASMTASALLEGTAIDEETVIEDLRIAGRRPYASAFEDGTFAGVTVGERGFSTAVAMIARMVRTPAFGATHLADASSGVVRAFPWQKSGLRTRMRRLLFEHWYGATHAWALEPKALKEVAAELTPVDIRKYHRTVYIPRHSAVVLNGAITATAAFALVERHFGDWSDDPGEPLRDSQRFVQREHDEPVTYLLPADEEDATVMAGFTAPPFGHGDMHAVFVLAQILGGSLTSRTQVRLRHERGLTYSGGATYTPHKNAGYVELAAAVDNDEVASVAKIIRAEVQRVRTEGIGAEELRAAKAAYRRTYSLQDPDAATVQLGLVFCSGRDALWFEAVDAAIDAITAQDVARVAKTYVPEHVDLVLAGDTKAFDGLEVAGVVKRIR
ncbi:MAG: pitrilysin family protein [Deltaproteobacteria bacterium]